MSRYRIQRIDLNDEAILEQVENIHGGMFEEDVGVPYDDMFWGAYDIESGLMIGYCSMKIERRRKQVKLTSCAIKEKHRGQGLQSRMIKRRIQEAKALGIYKVVTHTVCNPPSENNLIRCGFRLFRPRIEWAGEYANYWIKILVA